jgi:hypothetical protein
VYEDGAEKPIYGHVMLGSEYTSDGQVFAKLHQLLSELRTIAAFDRLYYEEAINPAQLTGHTNIDTLRVLSGLCAHAQSFGYATGCRIVMAVNVSSWRKHFVGAMPRGTKSKQWKDYALERCRQYGWKPKNSDEADALGLLDYSLHLDGITPPWRQQEVLRPVLWGAK